MVMWSNISGSVVWLCAVLCVVLCVVLCAVCGWHEHGLP